MATSGGVGLTYLPAYLPAFDPLDPTTVSLAHDYSDLSQEFLRDFDIPGINLMFAI